MFQSVPLEKAELLQSGDEKMYCPNCGMHLPKFYKTSHAVKLKSGEVRQYCSIHCLVEEQELTALRGKKDQIEKMMVVDVPSLKFIDVHDAFYVVGSSKKGTMTMTSKYAFKERAAADKFAEENGGEVMLFDDVYKVVLTDYKKDINMVHNKRSSKMYKMGKKLFDTKCDQEKIANMHAHSMGAMKAMIKNSGACGTDLNDGQLQGILLYWWDVKLGNFEKVHGSVLK